MGVYKHSREHWVAAFCSPFSWNNTIYNQFNDGWTSVWSLALKVGLRWKIRIESKPIQGFTSQRHQTGSIRPLSHFHCFKVAGLTIAPVHEASGERREVTGGM